MTDNEYKEHLRIIAQWVSESELRKFTRWMTAEELENLLKAAGSPEELVKATLAMKEIVRQREKWAWVWEATADLARYITGVGGALVLLGAAAKWLGLWTP